ncbi:tRNA (guanine(37)-N(1))-methyltransferase [hydrothermal vent metagenome]|uniref:tRNA (guanine-N(1)-)-methyltransferase n=1 Tax=hydrothermal vent metagenome TaxID=652676 RepID=A0A3B1B3X7_9ZZZZ
MRIEVVTLFPDMFQAITDYGISSRALKNDLLQLGFQNPREYASDRHRTVDDRPYGGGPGMVMMVAPLREAIRAAREKTDSASRVIYLSPQGRKLDQAGLVELSERPGLIMVCGRYEGVDERLIRSEVDEEWSIGDYVLSGGELAAMVLIDGLIRLLPGALGHEDSAERDSFSEGLLDYPHYTRPQTIAGEAVPTVLMSGDHAAIERWRQKQALGRTWLRRPELLNDRQLDQEQQSLLAEFIREHEIE